MCFCAYDCQEEVHVTDISDFTVPINPDTGGLIEVSHTDAEIRGYGNTYSSIGSF
jgi:hypothetical protein